MFRTTISHRFTAEIGPLTGEWAADVTIAVDIDVASEAVDAMYLVSERAGGEKLIEIIRFEEDPFLAMCWRAASIALAGEKDDINEKIAEERRNIGRRAVAIVGERNRMGC